MASTKRKAPPVKVAKPQVKKSVGVSTKAGLNDRYANLAAVPNIPMAQKLGEDAADSDASSDQDFDEMDQDDDDDDEEDSAAEASAAPGKTNGRPAVNGTAAKKQKHVDEDDDEQDDDNEDDDDASDHEPTFGDLVRSQETIDVSTMLGLTQPATSAEAEDDANAAKDKSKMGQPSLASLGNLLNAALRNNDDDNLDVCLDMTIRGGSHQRTNTASSKLDLAALPSSSSSSTNNAAWMRNTIQRMDPALSGRLLQKLAARMYQHPGRAQTLVGWVQWILIAHGGVLLTQPGVVRALQDLSQVLEERARGLSSLLLLKGKLDMLEAQMQMRRGQRASGHVRSRKGLEAKAQRNRFPGITIYMEGPRDFDRENRHLAQEGVDGGIQAVPGEILVTDATTTATTAADLPGILEQSEEDDEDYDDDDSEDDDEMDDDDEDDEDAIDFDDVDEVDEDDEEAGAEAEAEAVPPSKMQKKSASTFSKRR